MVVGVGFSPTKRVEKCNRRYVMFNITQGGILEDKFINDNCKNCDLFVEESEDDCIQCSDWTVHWKWKREK